MATVKNASPLAILNGIKDESPRNLGSGVEQIPTHLPHIFFYAERGKLTPRILPASDIAAYYGAKTLDYKERYTTHATVLLNRMIARQNAVFCQRVVPADAPPPASVRIWLDLVADDIPAYQRNADGSYMTDADGFRIPIAGTTFFGYRGRWVLEEIPFDEAVGDAEIQLGNYVSENRTVPENSLRYPIMDLQVSSQGDYGNNCGFRLSAPNLRSADPVDEDVIQSTGSQLYRLQLVERATPTSSGVVQDTINGETFVEFSFKEGSIHPKSQMELFVDDIAMQAWNRTRTPNVSAVEGLFDKFHIYHDNLEIVLSLLKDAEAEAQTSLTPLNRVVTDESDPQLINFLTGTHYEGTPYYAYVVEGPSRGGAIFSETTTHYASGGGNGSMNYGTFDDIVSAQLEGYGESGYPFYDPLTYPHSVFYDTGFTLETKRKFFLPMARRKDVYVVLSTQDITQPPNSPSVENSIATSLRASARLYPESEINGTSVCRAIIIGQAGYLIDSRYRLLVPMTIDYADKCALYMGSDTGIWRRDYSIDISPNNQVTLLRDINGVYKKEDQRQRDWAAGLVWVQAYDTMRNFYPAVQTVYDDDTSILNAAPIMMIAVELEKCCHRVWRELVGISQLTDLQFIERSNRLLRELTMGRFDDRVILEFDTYYSGADALRGYSWSCRIIMYGGNMKSVGSFTIVSRRRSDYTGG